MNIIYFFYKYDDTVCLVLIQAFLSEHNIHDNLLPSLQIIILCNIGYHWIVCRVDLRAHTLILYDSLSWRWKEEPHIRADRKRRVKPLQRIIPLLLHLGGFYDWRRGMQPIMQELGLFFVRKDRIWEQRDSHSCGPYALATATSCLTNRIALDDAETRMRTEYRLHIAYTVYRFSTHESTWVPQAFHDDIDD